jgi:2,4-dienoyl-CoA reductase-like NADH-dependent reductase (Old Yellow Enzyme family)
MLITTIMDELKASSDTLMNSNPMAAPIRLRRGPEIKNRLMKSAMSEALGSTDNRLTASYVSLYKAWANGGIGLLITGNVMIDRRALGEPNNVAIEDDRDMPLLKQWASAATENNTQCWVQLNHPGKQSPKGLNAENLSPSAIPFKPDMQSFFDTPRAFEIDEIDDVISRFGRSAALVKEAGFSGVQIHGAHGYLVGQFLSPHTNHRTDKWGGSAENRREFVLAVYREIRQKVGDDFPIGIKLNSADFQKGGFTEDESLAVIKHLEGEGIDHVEISGGTYEKPSMSGKDIRESTKQREAYFLEFAEKIRNEVKVPLAVTGGFRSALAINNALRGGSLDMVGLARPLAVDVQYPNKLLAGQTIDINVNPIKTGIKAVDNMGIMEVAWYSRQLKRISNGQPPKPNENALVSFMKVVVTTGFNTFKTKRLRAKG